MSKEIEKPKITTELVAATRERKKGLTQRRKGILPAGRLCHCNLIHNSIPGKYLFDRGATKSNTKRFALETTIPRLFRVNGILCAFA
jgi:hypothetical protein